jgi:hypothetical protein
MFLQKLGALVLATSLLANGVAQAAPAPEINEDANPYVDVTDFIPNSSEKITLLSKGEKLYMSSKAHMQWGNGYLSTTYWTLGDQKQYRLIHVDCILKQGKTLYKTIIRGDNGFYNQSVSSWDAYNSVENSRRVVGLYCKQPLAEIPTWDSMPTTTYSNGVKIHYYVTERNNDIINVYEFFPPSATKMVYGYSHRRYNCKSKERKFLFDFQIMANGEVVQYQPSYKGKWEKFGDKVMETFCFSK